MTFSFALVCHFKRFYLFLYIEIKLLCCLAVLLSFFSNVLIVFYTLLNPKILWNFVLRLCSEILFSAVMNRSSFVTNISVI